MSDEKQVGAHDAMRHLHTLDFESVVRCAECTETLPCSCVIQTVRDEAVSLAPQVGAPDALRDEVERSVLNAATHAIRAGVATRRSVTPHVDRILAALVPAERAPGAPNRIYVHEDGEWSRCRIADSAVEYIRAVPSPVQPERGKEEVCGYCDRLGMDLEDPSRRCLVCRGTRLISREVAPSPAATQPQGETPPSVHWLIAWARSHALGLPNDPAHRRDAIIRALDTALSAVPHQQGERVRELAGIIQSTLDFIPSSRGISLYFTREDAEAYVAALSGSTHPEKCDCCGEDAEESCCCKMGNCPTCCAPTREPSHCSAGARALSDRGGVRINDPRATTRERVSGEHPTPTGDAKKTHDGEL